MIGCSRGDNLIDLPLSRCSATVQEKGLTPSALRMQAQTAAAAAETSALEAAKHARTSHCIQALTAAQAAAQSFNLVYFSK